LKEVDSQLHVCQEISKSIDEHQSYSIPSRCRFFLRHRVVRCFPGLNAGIADRPMLSYSALHAVTVSAAFSGWLELQLGRPVVVLCERVFVTLRSIS